MSISRAVGTHPRCAALARERAIELLGAHNLQPLQTAVILIGHGTARHTRSRTATLNVAAALREPSLFADVHAFFLDDTPPIDSVYAVTRRRNLIVLPFLIGSGYHATRDIPRRLGLDPPKQASFPITGRVAGRFVVCDAAIGTRPQITSIILERARDAAAVRNESGNLASVV